MKFNVPDIGTALMYALVAISGATGGCIVAAHQVLRGRSLTLILIWAYALIGFAFGVAGMAALLLLTVFEPSLEKLLFVGLGFGIFGAVTLAGANLSAKLIMRRLGVEIDVSVKKIEGDDRHG
jgi:hypothetical protein